MQSILHCNGDAPASSIGSKADKKTLGRTTPQRNHNKHTETTSIVASAGGGGSNEPSRVMMGFGLLALLLSTISSTVVEPTYTQQRQQPMSSPGWESSSPPPQRYGGSGAPAYPTNVPVPHVEQHGTTPPGNGGGGTPPEFLEDAFYDAYYNFFFPNQETCPAYLTELEHSLLLRRGRRRARRTTAKDEEDDEDTEGAAVDGASSSDEDDDNAALWTTRTPAIAAVFRLACTRTRGSLATTVAHDDELSYLSSNATEPNCETGSRSSRYGGGDDEDETTSTPLHQSLSSIELLPTTRHNAGGGAATPSTSASIDEDGDDAMTCSLADLVALVLYNPTRAVNVVQQVVLPSGRLPRCAALTQTLLRMALPLPPSAIEGADESSAEELFGAVVCIPLPSAVVVDDAQQQHTTASSRGRVVVASSTPSNNNGCSVHAAADSASTASPSAAEESVDGPSSSSATQQQHQERRIHRLFFGQLRKDTSTAFVEHILTLMGIDVALDIAHVEMHTTSQGARAKGCAWVDARGDAVRDHILAFHKRIFLNDGTMFDANMSSGHDDNVPVNSNTSVSMPTSLDQGAHADESGEFLVLVDAAHVGMLERWTALWKEHPNRNNEKLSRGAIVIEVPVPKAKAPQRGGGASRSNNKAQRQLKTECAALRNGDPSSSPSSCDGATDATTAPAVESQPTMAADATTRKQEQQQDLHDMTKSATAAAYFSGMQGRVPFLQQQRTVHTSLETAPASASSFTVGGGLGRDLFHCPAWRHNPYDGVYARTFVTQ